MFSTTKPLERVVIAVDPVRTENRATAPEQCVRRRPISRSPRSPTQHDLPVWPSAYLMLARVLSRLALLA